MNFHTIVRWIRHFRPGAFVVVYTATVAPFLYFIQLISLRRHVYIGFHSLSCRFFVVRGMQRVAKRDLTLPVTFWRPHSIYSISESTDIRHMSVDRSRLMHTEFPSLQDIPSGATRPDVPLARSKTVPVRT